MSGAEGLPAFSFHWVGGDIAGLAALARQCAGVVPGITGADGALTAEVQRVVAAGSWHGSAATAFATAWDADARAGKQLAGAWGQIGTQIANLASDLAGLEHDLEQAAGELERQGVAVDPATGAALADVSATGNANVAPQVAAAHARLAGPYESYRAQVMDAARATRATTAVALDQLAGQLLPAATDWGQGATGLDALRSLWASPTEYRMYLEEEKLPEAEANLLSAERSAFRQLIALRKTAGNSALLPKATRDAIADAQRDEAELQSKIASAPESVATKLADGDAEGLGLTADGASGLVRVASGAVRAVPVLGALAGTGIITWQDMDKGENPGRAIADGVTSNAAGFGAGVAAAAGTGFLVGGMIGAGPVTVVAAGVVAGGAAAVGVGDFVHNLWQEKWGDDIHEYGMLGGIGHGVADSFDHTRHDLAHDLDDLKSLF